MTFINPVWCENHVVCGIKKVIIPIFSMCHYTWFQTLLREKAFRPIELNTNGCVEIGNGSHSKVNVQLFAAPSGITGVQVKFWHADVSDHKNSNWNQVEQVRLEGWSHMKRSHYWNNDWNFHMDGQGSFGNTESINRVVLLISGFNVNELHGWTWCDGWLDIREIAN